MKDKQLKTTLKSILYKSFLKTALIPLVIIELTLLLLYFGISDYMISKSKQSLSSEIRNNLYTILEKEAQNINFQLKDVSQQAKFLQNQQENIFKHKVDFLKISKKEEYKVAPNGVYYKVKDDGGASLWYGASIKIGEKEKEKAYFTGAFDDTLKYTVNKNDLIVASYFNSNDSMNRLYPFIKDVHMQYDPTMKIEEYNFYYEADEKHNPKKEPVWTSAYLDPAGLGWMVSCIVPIYNNNFLEGVTGLDVTIDKFINNILNLKLPWDAQAFLVGNDGLILAMPKKLEDIFSLKELNEHKYTDVVTKDNIKPEEFNIYKNEKLSKYFGKLLHTDTFMIESTINGKEYIIAQSKIEQTNWKLFVIVDKSIVYSPVNEVQNIANKIGLFAIAGMLLFYVIFFIFLSKKVKKIATFISSPISHLAQITKNFTTNLEVTKIENVEIEEIDLLSTNFYNMTKELYIKTVLLEDLNTSLKDKVKSEIEKNRQKDQTLLQQSRMAQMGELISMIAHQWRQPLASIASITIRMKFKMALEHFDSMEKEKQKEFLDYIENEIDDIGQLIDTLTLTIDDFRDFYKPNKEMQRLSLQIPIKKAISILKPEIINQSIELTEIYDFNGEALIYENELLQVFLNILKNTLDNFKEQDIENKLIEIQIKEENEKIIISIKDNGGGIDKTIIDKIFDPYFSTKDSKNGTGLGLYMSKIIIEQHHKGHIKARTIENFAYFYIELDKN
jgi:signal transduction histidine kinase